jgi:hypothetical protein
MNKQIKQSVRGWAGVASVAVVLGGCASDDTSAPATTTASSTVIEVSGTWSTPFGDETITATAWKSSVGQMAIVSADNSKNVAYTQNAADAPYGPNQFNKIVWTEPKDNAFFYCMVDYGKDTLALAQASTLTADDKDPAKGGCGGFPWTPMTKK